MAMPPDPRFPRDVLGPARMMILHRAPNHTTLAPTRGEAMPLSLCLPRGNAQQLNALRTLGRFLIRFPGRRTASGLSLRGRQRRPMSLHGGGRLRLPSQPSEASRRVAPGKVALPPEPGLRRPLMKTWLLHLCKSNKGAPPPPPPVVRNLLREGALEFLGRGGTTLPPALRRRLRRRLVLHLGGLVRSLRIN